MKAVTWHGKRDVRVGRGRRPGDQGTERRDHQGAPRPASAVPTCTSTNCSAPSSTRATSSATSRWASSRRSARGHQHQARRPRGDPVQHLRAATATPATRACTPSARPPRSATRARAPPCSATPSSTARSRRPGRVPAGAAGPVRADQGARGPPDERFLFLSDVLPTAWQAVAFADVPDGGVGGRSSASARSARWPPASPSTRDVG